MLGGGYRLSRDNTKQFGIHETQGAARAMNIQHMIECGKIFKVGDIISSVRVSKEVGKSVNISGQLPV